MTSEKLHDAYIHWHHLNEHPKEETKMSIQSRRDVETMKQALEALEDAVDHLPKPNSTDCANAADTLHTAIAECEARATEQAEKQSAERGEPVVLVEEIKVGGRVIGRLRRGVNADALIGAKLYTAPFTAQRQWVELTDGEIEPIAIEVLGYGALLPEDMALFTQAARAIEAKLKEKNT